LNTLDIAVKSLLAKMTSFIGDDRYGSVCILKLQSVLAQPSTAAHSPQELRAIWQAAGQRLRSHASADTWLYSDGAGRFACTFTGLDMKAATEYSETLRQALVQEPIPLTEGRGVPLEVSLGGAIANQANPVESTGLLKTADDALKQAQQRGSNRLYLLQATPSS
jgi:hypothetical protein